MKSLPVEIIYHLLTSIGDPQVAFLFRMIKSDKLLFYRLKIQFTFIRKLNSANCRICNSCWITMVHRSRNKYHCSLKCKQLSSYEKQIKIQTETIFIAANLMIYYKSYPLIPTSIFMFTNYTASLKCNIVC